MAVASSISADDASRDAGRSSERSASADADARAACDPCDEMAISLCDWSNAIITSRSKMARCGVRSGTLSFGDRMSSL